MTSRLLLLLGLLLPLGAVAQAPQNLDAVPGNQENSLTWDAPTGLDDDETVVCYGLYRDTAEIPSTDPEEQSEKRIEGVEATEGTPPTYTDTGLSEGQEYYYRVAAEVVETEERPVSCGDAATQVSSLSNQASATPLFLQLTEPSPPASPDPVEAGTAVDVTADVRSLPSGADVLLRSREGGEPTYVQKEMEGNEERTRTIPDSRVTLRGIEYVVEVRDEDEILAQAPSDGPASIRVEGEVTPPQQPSGAYRIVSFPTELDEPELSNIFEPLLPYDPSEWRLFSIGASGLTADGGYVEQNELEGASLSAGRALWFIRRNGGALASLDGTSVPINQPHEISLDEGWNLIGNPFAFDVPLSQVRVENTAGSLQDVLGYNGNNFVNQAGGALKPYRGYLVYLSGGQGGTLVVDPSPEDPSASIASARAPDPRWAVDLSARVGQARDPMNTFGTAPSATDGVEAADGREPPPIGDYVSLRFRAPSQDRGLWRDMRSTGGGLRTWTAEVRTNVSGLVTINASGISSVPDDQSVWLVDPVLDQTQNLRETPTYQFPASEATDARPLRILVGPAAAVQRRLGRDADRPERVELLPSVPHPVRSHATFRYRVPERTRATLELYDLLGRRVATLVDDESVGPGTHTYAWTRQDTGGTLSSGAYLLRLQAGDVTRTRRLVIMQ
jgi:hypothetical protein